MASFYQFLLDSTGQDDAVGDLARDATADPHFEKRSKTYASASNYLAGKGASDAALDTLKTAWKQYLAAIGYEAD